MKSCVRLGFVFVHIGVFTSLAQQPANSVCCRLTSIFNNYIMTSAGGTSKDFCNLFKSMNEWHFSKSKLIELPLDKIKTNYLRRNNLGCLFSSVNPTPLNSPVLVAYSKDVLINILNMDLNIIKSKEFSEFVAGNMVLNSSTPLAHRYGGHQFGYWATQLGDGRALLIGEFINE